MSYNPFDNLRLNAQQGIYTPKIREELQTINKQQMISLDERKHYEKQIENLKMSYAVLRRNYDMLERKYAQIEDANRRLNEMLAGIKPSYDSLADFAREYYHDYYQWEKQRNQKN